jgi:transmembrane sensor
MTDPRDDYQRLADYFADDCPSHERAWVEQWLAADPARRAVADRLDRARTALRQAGHAEVEAQAHALRARVEAWAAATSASHPVHVTPRPVEQRRPHRRLFARAVRWGAGLAAVVALGVGITHVWRHRPVAGDVPRAMSDRASRDVVTRRGQQASVTLPDGSRVTLAADSRLHIPGDFNRRGEHGRRQVELTGQAYFTVVHDTTRPFLVRTATAVTEDVGTSFVVSAYPEARATRVVVVEGAVALWDGRGRQRTERSSAADARDQRRGRPLMLLTRGDMAVLDTAGTALLTRNVSLDALTAWTRGVLAFDHVPLRDAIPQLNRWFDVDIRLATPSLGDRRVKAAIREESASEALRRLALVLDVNVRQHGRIVVLSPRTELPHD